MVFIPSRAISCLFINCRIELIEKKAPRTIFTTVKNKQISCQLYRGTKHPFSPEKKEILIKNTYLGPIAHSPTLLQKVFPRHHQSNVVVVVVVVGGGGGGGGGENTFDRRRHTSTHTHSLRRQPTKAERDSANTE